MTIKEANEIGNVVLIQPPTRNNISLAASVAGAEHLGLGYLAAAIEAAGIQCTIYNFERSPASPQEAVYKILEKSPLWTGITATSQSMEWITEFIKVFRKNCSGLIVCGGNLPTLLEEKFLEKVPGLDMIILGLGGSTAVNLSKMLASNEYNPKILHGVIYRENSDIVKNDVPSVTSFEELFSQRPKRNKEDIKSSARLLTSIGCHNRCSFCTTPSFFKKTRYERPVADVVEEMRYLNTTFGVSSFYFNDDSFLTTHKRSRERVGLLFEKIARDLPTASIRILTRSDAVVKWQEDLPLWRSQGLKSVFVGIESAVQSHLDAICKNTTVNTNIEALSILSKNSIVVTIGFIMFTEGITWDGIVKNLEFLKQTNQLYRTTVLCRCVLGYPGTLLYNSWKESERYDKGRSTDFLLYPHFQNRTIGNLSYAMELIEYSYSFLDNITIKMHEKFWLNHYDISRHETASVILSLTQAVYYSAFKQCIEIARRDADISSIYDSFLRNSEKIKTDITSAKLI